MCHKLPYRNFKWCDVSKYDTDMIKSYDKNSDDGGLLEVDIECPEEVALLHENLAFLPERRNTNGVEKLVTTLEDKKKYVVHILALEQALSHGLKLKKVHRVIAFQQKEW